MMDVEDDSPLDEESQEEYRHLQEGSLWKHRLLEWTVMIDSISFTHIEFHTKDTIDPDFCGIKREKENFLEEFLFLSTDVHNFSLVDNNFQ